MSSLSLSIIIVSHNEGNNLARTLESLLATTSSSDTEIIVIDDCSTDDTQSLLLQPPFTQAVRSVCTDRRIGAPLARNIGASKAAGAVLLFADAHVAVQPGWREPFLAPLQRADVGAVGPTIVSMNEPSRRGFGLIWKDASLKVEWLTSEPCAQLVSVPILCGCFVALKKAVFSLLGGFDPGLRMWGSEDEELSLHLWRLGYRCVVVPEVEVAHLFRPVFPYELDVVDILHNRLRMAAVHFGDVAFFRTASVYQARPTFSRACALIDASDAKERRLRILKHARRDDQSFFAEFCIRGLMAEGS